MLTRFPAFRDGLYARMEQVSFRTFRAVLGGVVAGAAVIAGLIVLTGQGSAPAARPGAAGRSPASQLTVPTPAPPAPAVSPSATPATSRPARTRALAAHPERAAAYVASGQDPEPDRAASASGYGWYAARWHVSPAAAAWVIWWRSRLAGGGHPGGLAAGSGGGHGFGGFGFGHGIGHR